jgi:drug/metabolite transporter (DMT)-like permease
MGRDGDRDIGSDTYKEGNDKNATVAVRKTTIWVASSELALWNFGALALLNVGLLFVESARASFLTQTSVVITPLVSSVSGHRVGQTVWVGCAVALAGLLLLSDKGRPSASDLDGDDYVVDVDGTGDVDSIRMTIHSVLSSLSFSAGDLLVLGGALSWSMYIFRLSSIGNQYPEIPLQAIKTLLIALLYTMWVVISATRCYFIDDGGWDAVAHLWLGWRSWQAWALLTFSAVGTGALADVLQQYGQKMVSASEANILLCVEPVFTMMLGRVLLGEVTSITEKVGGVLIVFAALLASR